MKAFYNVRSVEETWAVAAELAKELKPGDVVCLEGDLGAGKTTFTQGLAAALGATGAVASPTFCIVREHPASASRKDALSLVHMDLYRLSGEEEVESIGWEDYLSRGAVVAVEWPQRAGSLIPPEAWHVVFAAAAGDGEARTISVRRGCGCG